MAEKITLNLQPRTLQGKQIKHLRKEGFVPAVVYGAETEATNVQAIYNEIEKVVHRAGKHHIIEVMVGAASKAVLIKSIDIDPVKHRLRHVAFHAVNRNEKVTTDIPVVLTGEGESPAERAGLVVLQAIESLEISALPADLPDNLPVSVLELTQPGDKLTVGDIVLPKGVEFSHPEDVLELVLANVYEPSALQAANDAAGGDAEDAQADVPSDNGVEGNSEPQGAENRPGGKMQDQPKQSNVDAAKADEA
jgi:large subunit ribosomal protein L25